MLKEWTSQRARCVSFLMWSMGEFRLTTLDATTQSYNDVRPQKQNEKVVELNLK